MWCGSSGLPASDPGRRPSPSTYFRETKPTVFERVSPGLVRYARNRDFLTMRYSGGGNLTAPVVPVGHSGSGGCADSDFSGFAHGGIALMRRGGCPFSQKAGIAQSGGASAALIANDGLPGRTAPLSATLFGPGVADPGARHLVRRRPELTQLAQAGTVRVHLDLSVATTTARAANVIADLPGTPERRDPPRRAPRLGRQRAGDQRQRLRQCDRPRDRAAGPPPPRAAEARAAVRLLGRRGARARRLEELRPEPEPARKTSGFSA